MIDLHCHVLPGVDDGAADLSAAVEMCRLAATDGCRTLVATPHQRHPSWANDDRPALESRFRELQAAAEGLVELRLGAEIRADSSLLAEVDELPGGALLRLAGSRYLLVELPPVEVGIEPETLVHELLVAGFRPILAHPELVHYLAGDLPRAGRLVAAGALLQVTAMSLTGDFGRLPRQASWELLRAGHVHFVASDCHSPDWRPPGLSRARRLVAETCGEEVAGRLTEDHPAAVVADRDLPEAAQTARYDPTMETGCD